MNLLYITFSCIFFLTETIISVYSGNLAVSTEIHPNNLRMSRRPYSKRYINMLTVGNVKLKTSDCFQ